MDLNINELEEILNWADCTEDSGIPINRELRRKLKQELNEQESY